MDMAEDWNIKAKGQAIWLHVCFGNLSPALVCVCVCVCVCVHVHTPVYTFWACHNPQGRLLIRNISSVACHHTSHRFLILCKKAWLIFIKKHILSGK